MPVLAPKIDYTAMLAVKPLLATFTTVPKPPTMAPAPSAPAPIIKDRCSADEYWDRIEQSCYPKDAAVPLPTAKPPTRALAPKTGIDENGFSTPPPTPTPVAPIPESDGVRHEGETTVSRTPIVYSPPSGGSGSTKSYPYPGSSSPPRPGASELLTIDLPDPELYGEARQPAAASSKPFYKEPIVLLAGAALVAYLVLK